MGASRRGEATARAARRWRFALPFFVAFLATLSWAPAAQATFHEILVREVYPGANNDSYVELQMYAAGQNLLSGHSLTLYNSSGTLTHTSTFSSSVSNSASQSTVLIGDSSTQTTFGVAPDLVDSGLEVPASGGAACWIADSLSNADCVAWGNFSGGSTFESAVHTTVGTAVSSGGITSGKAIRRKITPGCATLLETGDDTNNSATDFEEVSPGPRNNASAVTEHACVAPTATIKTKPSNPTKETSASFTYESNTAEVEFECKLDSELSFSSCPPSGKSYPGPLAQGSHTFQVRAKKGAETGIAATYTWMVDLTPPTTEIKTKPPNPSSPNVGFTYSSNETGSTFECSLSTTATDSFSSCLTTGKSYSNLADGTYTFKVRATDKALNQGAPAEYQWEVNHLVADKEPPDTKIVTKPPNPTESSTASFTYESTEPGSNFECKLDSGEFEPCEASGKTYTGLGNGPHTFQVRATDSSANTDITPAGYSWEVVLPTSHEPPAEEHSSPPPPPPTTITPDTTITLKPAAKTHDRTPTIRFKSSVSGATYQCSVDRKAFKACRSPFTAPALKPGRHTVRVKAVAGGAADPTPASCSFKVLGKKRKHG